MLTHLKGLLYEIWSLLNEMAPYLLFGFLIAGLLHVLINRNRIYRHLANNDLLSIIKASLFGVPLPLCSCGVIPVAAHLYKEGAGKSATLAFLVSTPTTGVDSIMATYSLLGPLFAVIRPAAAFFSGIFTGLLNNFFDKAKKRSLPDKFSCAMCEIDIPHSHSIPDKIRSMLKYGFFDLIEDTWKWLTIGIIAGGLISFFIPENIIETYLGNPYIAYPLMILIAVPMYVCATGSIPIAASLILKGMSPGAGLVFLIAGPATNTATLSFVAGKLGRRSLIIYLFSIIITALLFGLLIDYIWYSSDKNMNLIQGSMKMLPHGLKEISSILLLLLFLRAVIKMVGKRKTTISSQGLILKVPDISCEHCVKTITSALKKDKAVKQVNIDLKNKNVQILGKVNKKNITAIIQKAGYTVEKKI